MKDSLLLSNVSHEETYSPSYSTDTALNSSSAHPGMIHQVLVAASIAHKGGQLADHVVRNIPRGVRPLLVLVMKGVLLLTQGGA